MKCPTCNHINRNDAIFCDDCSVFLGDLHLTYCPKCDYGNLSSSNYCKKCGFSLDLTSSQKLKVTERKKSFLASLKFWKIQ